MKNVGMESGGDYDQMLRAMFESCDTVGLGLLTPTDFEKLCKKLSMQEHSSLLSEFLFPQTNKRKLLSYETFRDTLVQFLTGEAEHCETENIEEKDISLEHQQDSWNNNSFEYNESNRIEPSKTDRLSKEHLISEGEENQENELLRHRNSPHKRNNSGSPGKHRRYGRTSQPDMDLLRNRENSQQGESERPIVLREVQVENTKHFGHLDESSPENSPWKAVEVSFVSEKDNPIIICEEEFTGEGNDDVWKNPDDWSNEINSNDQQESNESSVKAVQTELEIVWTRVVGDPMYDAMDEYQLGCLCSELGMGHISTSEDIAALFLALDQDCDGYVRFHEFSEQMSVFLNCVESEQIAPEPKRINSEMENSNVDGLPNINHNITSRDCVFSTSEVIEEECNVTLPNDVMHNPGLDTSFTMIKTPEKTESETVESSPILSDINSNYSSPASSMSSTESGTPEPRGRLSLDSDTSPLCPPVVSVEPRQLAAINRGRRRRRSSALAASNPAGARQQRKKSSRSIPLPHYHPASIRKLDELHLSYLTEGNERYVCLESLRQTWEQGGIENSASVLEALQVSSTEPSVSVEALSEVFEMEFDQNLLQKAALILYKRGINHYRAKYEHERAERSKQENKIEHLMSQLQEQEERYEKFESNYENKTEELESTYKLEIRTLTDELTAAQALIKEYEQESKNKKNTEYNEMNEKYERSQLLLDDLKTENNKLLKLKDEAELRLQESEDNMIQMQEDLDLAYRGIATFNRQHAAQRKQYAELLRMYEAQAQSISDSNDELLDRLQQSQRRWSSPRRSANARSKSSRTASTKSSPLLRNNSDTSSYSSASEDFASHQTSLFINEPPSPIMPNFATSSPALEAPSSAPGNVLTSNAFAFLTPSTTHAKSRVRSNDASLSIAPSSIILSDNCEK